MTHDSAMMEIAGTQCLLLAGFFEDQMRRRHNIRWYAELGSGFFGRAAAPRAIVRARPGCSTRSPSASNRGGERHARLSRALRDRPYLLGSPMI